MTALFHPQLELFEVPEEWWIRRLCRVCLGALKQPPGDTYVMHRDGFLKIGKSRHPETRLKELRAINRQKYIITPKEMDCTQPISLVAVIPGDQEHALHEQWKELHVRGEWFLPNAEMTAWLEALSNG